jgi:hypothetical protein
MGRKPLPDDQRKHPKVNDIRLTYPTYKQIEQINNVASWLGITTVEYVKSLIINDMKIQPEKYRLTKRPE